MAITMQSGNRHCTGDGGCFDRRMIWRGDSDRHRKSCRDARFLGGLLFPGFVKGSL